jgi:hypothetical protein
MKTFEDEDMGHAARAIDLDQAKLDPASVFNHPRDVIAAKGLTEEDRIDPQPLGARCRRCCAADEHAVSIAAGNYCRA